MRWLRWIFGLGRLGVPIRIYDGTVTIYACYGGVVSMAGWYDGAVSVQTQFSGTVGTLT